MEHHLEVVCCQLGWVGGSVWTLCVVGAGCGQMVWWGQYLDSWWEGDSVWTVGGNRNYRLIFK